jgi:hypothetical protein
LALGGRVTIEANSHRLKEANNRSPRTSAHCTVRDDNGKNRPEARSVAVGGWRYEGSPKQQIPKSNVKKKRERPRLFPFE